MKMMSTILRCVSLQCLVLVVTAVAEPVINVSPPKIIPGLTSSLDINCTFSLDNHPEMASFISLDLSRANAADGNFEDVATITELSPDSASVLTQENVTVTGVHSQTGESFLQATWEFPTNLQSGVYQCSAHGTDRVGENSVLNNTASVTFGEANLSDVVQTLMQIQMHESAMENTVSTMAKYIETLENNKMAMENEVKDLGSNISRIENTVELMPLVSLIGKYQDKSYYVSNYGLGNVTYATKTCKSLGGQLTEIDDEHEYLGIQGLLNDTTGFHFVLIAGSDEDTEGNWRFPSTKENLPFVNWHSERPKKDET